ncbi:Rrf2 family transcriptional regulator [bacterium SCSIO 12741]|nr:Rrf2 family transcriptional regulator [bacterium SCSIO 12741]
MISKKTKYALLALGYLAEKYDQGPQLISEIAVETKIPKKFLEAILLELKKIGVLSSKMGKGGGYYLRKPPSDVGLAKIIRFMNGPIAMLPCVSLNFYEKCDECTSEKECGLNKVMIEVRDTTLKVLENKTVADLINR